VSVIVPQARILNGLQSLATGSYAFVGSAEAEMKATDSTTGEMLDGGAISARGHGNQGCSVISMVRRRERDRLLGAEDNQPVAAIAGQGPCADLNQKAISERSSTCLMNSGL
jgi:hypothetical protein